MFNKVLYYTQKINYFILIYLFTSLISPCVNAQPVFNIGTFQKETNTLTKIILLQAYQRLNIKIKFIYLPAERSLKLSNAGVIDAEDSRLEGLEKNYPNLIKIKTPIVIVSLYAYSKNKNIKIQGWQDLKTYRVAYLRGAKIIEKNIVGFNAEKVSNINQAFAMLKYDRVDLVISNTYQAKDIIESNKEIKKLTPAIYEFPVYHYVNKKHADLVPKLEVIFDDILHDRKNK